MAIRAEAQARTEEIRLRGEMEARVEVEGFVYDAGLLLERICRLPVSELARACGRSERWVRASLSGERTLSLREAAQLAQAAGFRLQLQATPLVLPGRTIRKAS